MPWIAPVILIAAGLVVAFLGGLEFVNARDRFAAKRPDHEDASTEELIDSEPSVLYLPWAALVVMPLCVLGGTGWLIWTLS